MSGHLNLPPVGEVIAAQNSMVLLPILPPICTGLSKDLPNIAAMQTDLLIGGCHRIEKAINLSQRELAKECMAKLEALYARDSDRDIPRIEKLQEQLHILTKAISAGPILAMENSDEYFGTDPWFMGKLSVEQKFLFLTRKFQAIE